LLPKKCLKTQKNQIPKQQQGKWSSRQQEDDNKKQDNANPTLWEMKTIQVDCCKMFTNKKNRKPKQVDNKKTMTNNRTTQTQTNNVGNEHDKSSKHVHFVSKYLVYNFSTFDPTSVNCQK
jgi:hypothetical protein